MPQNSWHVFCDPLNRADHWIRQSDIPKAIANFKALTGEMPKYIMACPPSKYMDELTVPENIELILQTGVSSWELRLAAALPYPENHGAEIFREKIGEPVIGCVAPKGSGMTLALSVAPPNILDTPQDVKKPTDKTVYPKDVPPSLTKLIIDHLDASEKCLPHRHRKVGEVSVRTLYRRQAELKRKQQPVMI